MRKYNSKIGLGIILFLVVIFGGTSIIMIFNKIWLGLIINIIVIAFISHLFLTTSYIIDGKLLIIKAGFLINKTINIETIDKVSETNNPISSPALSIDRLEIKYNKFENELISPKEKDEFIKHLKGINPKIEFKMYKGK